MTSPWYYAQNGKKIGPISDQELLTLYKAGKLEPDTHVWTEGLKDWIPVRDSALLGPSLANTPPPLAGHLVSNVWVWCLAFMPLLFAIVGGVLDQMRFDAAMKANEHAALAAWLRAASGRSFGGVPWQITTVTYGFLAFIDERRLNKAGYSTRYFPLMAILLAPIYLFVRAKKLKQFPWYGLVFIGCAIIDVATSR